MVAARLVASKADILWRFSVAHSKTMSYASFATLDEAWGGIGISVPPAPPVTARNKSVTDPLPSDVDYNRAGAPIMDDIVNLYTPADTASRPMAIPQVKKVSERRESDTDTEKQQQKAKQTEKDSAKRRAQDGDDYSDSDSDQPKQPRQSKQTRQLRQRRGQTDEEYNSNAIELAAYVLSGVMLIFLFETFITIGGSLRASSSYY